MYLFAAGETITGDNICLARVFAFLTEASLSPQGPLVAGAQQPGAQRWASLPDHGVLKNAQMVDAVARFFFTDEGSVVCLYA